MDAGLKLDGMGECFKNKMEYGRSTREEFIQRHKFYLSFENSLHCNDYISEKFWRNSLYNLAVPIVYGPHVDDVKAG